MDLRGLIQIKKEKKVVVSRRTAVSSCVISHTVTLKNPLSICL